MEWWENGQVYFAGIYMKWEGIKETKLISYPRLVQVNPNKVMLFLYIGAEVEHLYMELV